MTPINHAAARPFGVRSICLPVAVLLVFCIAAAPAMGANLPASVGQISFPGPAANAFSTSVRFSPANGLLYAWNGAQVFRQDAPSVSTFTSIGAINAAGGHQNSADPGPIAFSQDGAQIVVGNGAGGLQGGADTSLIFTLPATGGSSNTASGAVDFHNDFLGVPGATGKYFVDQGNASFDGSSVSVFDAGTGSNKQVITGIPGSSTSMGINGAGRLFVGAASTTFPPAAPSPHAGEIRSFALADLAAALSSNSPLDWNSANGALFNSAPNNSGAGMFFDARGYLFTGGPNGVTVFDTLGNAQVFNNPAGYTAVTYNPANDQLLLTTFFSNTGTLYQAGAFAVPEPASLLMGLLALAALAAIGCRARQARIRQVAV